MKTLSRFFAIVATLLATLFASAAMALDLPGPIVSAEWLAANKNAVQIVDVRSDVKSYTREPVLSTDKKTGKSLLDEVGGYLPGALIMDYNVVRSEKMLDGQKTKYLIPEKEELESRLRAIGLTADKPIVLVSLGIDPSDVMEALRLYWTLKVYGEDRVAILDGGLAGWLVSGRSYETGALKKATPGNWSAKAYRAALVADSNAVAAASKSTSVLLIDGRDAGNFYGLTKRAYVSSYGHIANAKSLPPEVLFRSVQGALYFLNKSQYASLVKLAGIDANAPVITYCNSGHLASGTWFVMHEMLGNRNASLYDGALYLWSRENRPLVGVL